MPVATHRREKLSKAPCPRGAFLVAKFIREQAFMNKVYLSSSPAKNLSKKLKFDAFGASVEKPDLIQQAESPPFGGLSNFCITAINLR